MKHAKRPANPNAKRLYLTEPERRAMKALTSKLNIRTESGVVRHAIRKLAEANAVKVG